MLPLGKKKGGLLQRLLLLFVLILLPVIVFGLVSLIILNTKLEAEITQSYISRAANWASEMDNSLKQAHELSAAILERDRVGMLANPKYPMLPYERVMDINFLCDLLTNVKNSNPDILNVRVYLPYAGVAYNASAYSLGSQQKIDIPEFDDLLNLRKIPGNLHIYDNRFIMLWFSSLSSPLSAAEVELRKSSLTNSLYESLIDKRAYYIFRLSDGQMLTNLGDQALVIKALAQGETKNGESVYSASKSYSIFTAELPYTGASYRMIVPNEYLFRPMRMSAVYAAVYTFIILLCVTAFLYGTMYIVHKPLHLLMNAFESIKRKDFNVRVSSADTKEFTYLYDGFNSMVERLDILIQQDYRQKILMQKAELKQLQAQINPHFLFNSFFMLCHMIDGGMTEESGEVARLLGRYFQYITRSGADSVTLQDEYDHAITYTDIQSKRFEGRVRVMAEPLPEAYASYMVPRLILQPVLENAFNYGVERIESEGLITLRFAEEESGVLCIIIEDNGEKLTDETLSKLHVSFSKADSAEGSIETTGLINIYKRLRIYYQRAGVLEAERSELGGLKVTIRLFSLRNEGEMNV